MIEHPVKIKEMIYSLRNISFVFDHQRSQKSKIIYEPSSNCIWTQVEKRPLPLSDSRKDEKHPQVDTENQYNLEDELSQDALPQVKCAVNNHGAELNEEHD